MRKAGIGGEQPILRPEEKVGVSELERDLLIEEQDVIGIRDGRVAKAVAFAKPIQVQRGITSRADVADLAIIPNADAAATVAHVPFSVPAPKTVVMLGIITRGGCPG